MTKRAELPDGTILEFPDDTPDAVMDRVVKAQLFNASAKPATTAAPVRSANAQGRAPKDSAFAGLITGRKPVPQNAEDWLLANQVGNIAEAAGYPQINQFSNAVRQHGLSALHGLAQLGVAGLEKAGIAPEGTSARDQAALAQREAQYQARTPTTPASLAGAAVGELAPWLTGMGELRAAGLLPTVTATGLKGAAIKGGLLAGEGALMGAATPVTEGDFGQQKTGQIATGALAAPLLAAGLNVGGKTAMLPVKGAKAVADVVRRYRNPGQEAERSLAELVAPTPENIGALRGYQQYLQGETPTLDQILSTPDNPTYVQAARALRTNPETALPFIQQQQALQQQVGAQVKQLAATPRREAAAKRLRSYLTTPYFESLKGVQIDPTPILKKIDAFRRTEEGTLPAVREAADKIWTGIQENTVNGTIDASLLRGFQKNAAKFFGNNKVTAEEKRALGPVQDAVIETIESAVPGLRANLGTYARASEPLQAMAAGRKLIDPNAPGGVSFAGDKAISAARVKALLRADDAARFKMPKTARKQLENVRDALTRAEQSDAQIGPRGPQSAYDLTAAQGLLPRLIYGTGENPGALARSGGAVGAGFGSLLGPLGAAIGSQAGQAIPKAAQRANQRVAQRLSGLLANAPEAAAALEREAQRRALLQRGNQRSLLPQYGMPGFLLPYLEQ